MTKYYRIFFIFLEINYLDMRFCISVHFVHCLQTSHTVHTIMEKEHSYLSPIKRPLQHVNYLNMAPLCIRKQIWGFILLQSRLLRWLTFIIYHASLNDTDYTILKLQFVTGLFILKSLNELLYFFAANLFLNRSCATFFFQSSADFICCCYKIGACGNRTWLVIPTSLPPAG